jgi:hypothetical protein
LHANEPAPQLMPACGQCMVQPPPVHFMEQLAVSSQVTVQFEPHWMFRQVELFLQS